MIRRPLALKIPWHFVLVGIAALGWLFMVRQALAPFFLAMVLAYLLLPLTERLSRRLGRSGAAMTVLLATTILLGIALLWLIPLLIQQTERLVEAFPAWKRMAEARWLPWLGQHPEIEAKLRLLLGHFDADRFIKGVQLAGASLMALFLRLMSYLLVPVILYYLLVDGPSVIENLDSLVPPRHRMAVRTFFGSIHERLGGYIRGQLALATVMSILQGLAFMVQGIPYFWLLGLVAGFSNLVPYSPYITALPVALFLAGALGAGWGKLLAILIVFVAVQKVEAFYLTPVWVGRASRLHPLEVLLAVLTFGSAFGLVGLIFAVPLMIVIKVSSEHLTAHYRDHRWFKGEETPEERR
ncbi:AI-2E family transporter [Holophaga foetida]|uniref:AI-2E family transporter n=1 Tax=Holophaga foetida TaxID=35839 RepID=UPI0002473B21|nr:AI-2E family transporter [Holophaga foetida]